MPIGHDPAADPALFCTTPDGIDLAVYDFGGAGEDLLLVHATGFCAGVLLPLARSLGDRYHCWALDLRGHGRSGRPVDGDFAWSGFCTDVLATVDRLELDRPSGFGHSCGGAALLLAEQARPDTFRSFYLFEPVVIPDGFTPSGPEDNPLSQGARRRRETFPSADDAFANFSSKPPLGDLDPDVLLRYVEDGFEPVPADEGGDGTEIRLRCWRDDEAEVYQHGLGNGVYPRLHEVQCPVTLAFGRKTQAFGLEIMVADAEQLPLGTLEPYDDLGHFGPLQRPGEVAAGVMGALAPPDGTPRS